jgi:hypothetical protein
VLILKGVVFSVAIVVMIPLLVVGAVLLGLFMVLAWALDWRVL